MSESVRRYVASSQVGYEETRPSGKLALLLDHWLQLCAAGLPRRRDIDLMRLDASLLPHVFLLDVLDGGARFRWRLIGTEIVRHSGTDDTGLDLEISVMPKMRPTVLAHNRQVVSERRPLAHRGDFVSRDRRIHRFERLLLPVLADAGDVVDTVLGGAVFTPGLHTTP